MWKIAALYRFVTIGSLPVHQAELKALCRDRNICGTLLLAPEGINGTIAGQPDDLDGIIDELDDRFGIRQGELKFSAAAEKPFLRLKVRLKKEIITMRAPEADPSKKAGTYVEPGRWNDLLSDPDVILIDTRNSYETKTGLFRGAIDPQIDTFSAFKDFVARALDPQKHKKIAMYCTGGIRCEKASSYMLAQGFEEVYHLKGGILKYLETIPANRSLWEGECFVFDKRVTVGHGLGEGRHDMCYGCRMPLSEEETSHPSYEDGVSCPHCIAALTPEKAESLRMRHRQMSPQAGR